MLLSSLILFSTSLAFGKATLGIWPVRINLTPDQKIGEVIIRNKDKKEIKAQVYAKTWDMDKNGKFVETDTGDFVFFPRLLTIPGESKKTLRVGYNGDFPAVEKPYRLYIQELPEIKSFKKQTVKMDTSFNFLLKLSIPIFVRPSNSPEPVQIKIMGVKPSESSLKINLYNAGIRNFLIKKINVQLMDKNGSGINEYDNDYVQRVLPKRSAFLQIPFSSKQCSKAAKLLFKAFLYSSDTPITQTVDLNPGCTMTTSSIPITAE